MFANLLSRLLAKPTNIRLAWDGLTRTNTLTYYEKFAIYGRKKVLIH